MSDCIFCDIAAGKAPHSLVYEDEVALAFMDIRPITPGHLLVIPRKHFAYLSEIDEETGMHLFRVAMRMQEAIRSSGLKCEGVNLFLADGAAAGQEVFHVHLHVFPRFEGDNFRIVGDWPVSPPRSELDETALMIRDALPKG